jgi:carbonic anhydrase
MVVGLETSADTGSSRQGPGLAAALESSPTEERTSMSKIVEEVLSANQKYQASFGEKGSLALPPARGFAILTCMDARIDPARLAGLSEGDAHVIRNAGGRASDDAIRSLVIPYKLLGTREWFVIHHSNCGMELFSDEIIRGLLQSSLETSSFEHGQWKDKGAGPGSSEGDYVDWLTIKNQAESVLADVQRIKKHPLVPKHIPVYGYIYQVESGRLVEVPQATAAGRAG